MNRVKVLKLVNYTFFSLLFFSLSLSSPASSVLLAARVLYSLMSIVRWTFSFSFFSRSRSFSLPIVWLSFPLSLIDGLIIASLVHCDTYKGYVLVRRFVLRDVQGVCEYIYSFPYHHFILSLPLVLFFVCHTVTYGDNLGECVSYCVGFTRAYLSCSALNFDRHWWPANTRIESMSIARRIQKLGEKNEAKTITNVCVLTIRSPIATSRCEASRRMRTQTSSRPFIIRSLWTSHRDTRAQTLNIHIYIYI